MNSLTDNDRLAEILAATATILTNSKDSKQAVNKLEGYVGEPDHSQNWDDMAAHPKFSKFKLSADEIRLMIIMCDHDRANSRLVRTIVEMNMGKYSVNVQK